MLSRRDFISGQFISPYEEGSPETESDVKEEAGLEDLQAIASDFSEEMLCREMMRMGKDPSNMNREQMLQMLLDEMRTQ